jgi:hypothetical protein
MARIKIDSNVNVKIVGKTVLNTSYTQPIIENQNVLKFNGQILQYNGESLILPKRS